MSPGVSIRTSFLPVLIPPKIPHGSEPRCDDMVRYTAWASEGLAHHFAVESDETQAENERSLVRSRRDVADTSARTTATRGDPSPFA
jgi:hypothetical protein